MIHRSTLHFFPVALMSLGLVTCNHDHLQNPPPEISEEAKAYADAHWTYWDGYFGGFWEEGIWFGSYLDYEYYAAHFYGRDGVQNTLADNFMETIDDWCILPWGPLEDQDRLDYLPANGFAHHIDPDIKDDQFYERIGRYDQFGAGWPADGDLPLPGYEQMNPLWDYRDLPHDNWMWEAQNSYRDQFLNMIGAGGN